MWLNFDLFNNAPQLTDSLKYLLDASGNPNLMTPQLIQTLCEHSAGNYRVLCNMANTMLLTGLQKDKRIARSLIIDLGIHAKIESLPSQMVLPQTSTSVPIFQKTSLQSRF